MPPCLRAFSLIEMMIAIVILGLGLIMTATMFPVAWTRARSLTEYTTQRSISASVDAAVSLRLQAAGPSRRNVTISGQPTPTQLLAAGGIAGDFFYDPTLAQYGQSAIIAYSDRRVHALNLGNLRPFFDPDPAKQIMDEDPWRIEQMFDIESDYCHPILGCGVEVFNIPPPDRSKYLGEFLMNSFYTARATLEQRFHPPLDPMPSAAADSPEMDRWRDRLSSRRYAWGALHRLRSPVGPPPIVNLPPAELAAAVDASGTTRVVDLYVVTLRRAQPSHRFAIQNLLFVPNPYDRTFIAAPQSLAARFDAVLPVPWRVQIELPKALNLRNPPVGSSAGATGVPTEVQVPPARFPGSADAKRVLAGMFPTGTQFVDEVNGQIYRVTKRREGLPGTPTDGFAFLTLDRELVWEEFDDSDDPAFQNNFVPDSQGRAILDADEFIRAVWVYPPSVDRSQSANETLPIFEDSSPVVGIDVRTISLSPPG